MFYKPLSHLYIINTTRGWAMVDIIFLLLVHFLKFHLTLRLHRSLVIWNVKERISIHSVGWERERDPITPRSELCDVRVKASPWQPSCRTRKWLRSRGGSGSRNTFADWLPTLLEWVHSRWGTHTLRGCQSVTQGQDVCVRPERRSWRPLGYVEWHGFIFVFSAPGALWKVTVPVWAILEAWTDILKLNHK